jgi:hypothetical protein
MLYDPKWETTVTPVEAWRAALLKAADLIRQRGLAKRSRQTSEGSLCLHGAILMAKYDNPWADDFGHCDAVRAVYHYLRSTGVSENMINPDGLAYWNNEPERTAEDVIKALEAAARN